MSCQVGQKKTKLCGACLVDIYVQMNTTFMSDARRVSVCARVQPVSLRLAHLYIVIMLILNYYLPPSERKCDLKSYI